MKLLKKLPECVLKNRYPTNFSEFKSKAFGGAALQISCKLLICTCLLKLLKYHGSSGVFVCFSKQNPDACGNPVGGNLNKCK